MSGALNQLPGFNSLSQYEQQMLGGAAASTQPGGAPSGGIIGSLLGNGSSGAQTFSSGWSQLLANLVLIAIGFILVITVFFEPDDITANITNSFKTAASTGKDIATL